MKALLMYQDRDFDLQAALPGHEQTLTEDLELTSLQHAMAGEDAFLAEVAHKALLSSLENDSETILHRQAIMQDCLKNPSIVRELYELAVEGREGKRKFSFHISSWYPAGVLHDAMGLMRVFVVILRKLKKLADTHAGRFESRGFSLLYEMLRREFSDEYFASIEKHLKELEFKEGLLLSAELGAGNTGKNFVLRLPREKRPNWFQRRLLGQGKPEHSFDLAEGDETGAKIVSELRDRGINQVANALAQSTDHTLSFFDVLRTELAFYVGCLNLHDALAAVETPVCFPRPEAIGTRRLHFDGLHDANLALTMGRKVVGNTVDADGKNLIIITGANQGGKSSFLRSLGLAQIMMHSGMFVAAEDYGAELCAGLFSHYKREEDETMAGGKLDEELARLSEIADAITPDSMLLFNESFSSTNEREGSEIARQVVSALLEKRIKVVFVTHTYDFSHGQFERNPGDALFLLAERREDGTRSFKLVPGEPLETSYGEDLYEKVFGVEAGDPPAGDLDPAGIHSSSQGATRAKAVTTRSEGEP
jgi:hypothetical protein